MRVDCRVRSSYTSTSCRGSAQPLARALPLRYVVTPIPWLPCLTIGWTRSEGLAETHHARLLLEPADTRHRSALRPKINRPRAGPNYLPLLELTSPASPSTASGPAVGDARRPRKQRTGQAKRISDKNAAAHGAGRKRCTIPRGCARDALRPLSPWVGCSRCLCRTASRSRCLEGAGGGGNGHAQTNAKLAAELQPGKTRVGCARAK